MDPVPKVYSHPLEFFDGLTLLESGKVREIFAMTEDYLLLITTDRISGIYPERMSIHVRS